MADIQCPNCGFVSRIPDGMPANCVQCGLQLPTGAAFPQDLQYAQQPEPQFEQPYGIPVPQYQQPVVPEQQINVPEMLKQAKKKRRDWHILNGIMYAVQMASLILGVTWDDRGSDTDMSVPLIGAWLASLVLFSFVSAYLRPEDAYPDKPKFIRNKVLYGFVHFLISLTSFISSAVLYAILAVLFE